MEEKSSTHKKIIDLLIHFKESRGITYTRVAKGINVTNTYLSDILSGSKPATSEFLFKLEQFFRLDNLNQVASIDRTIEDLTRQKAVLREQTIEKFYAERKIGMEFPHQTRPENPALNEAPQPKVIISSGETSLGQLMAKAIVSAKIRKIKGGAKE